MSHLNLTEISDAMKTFVVGDIHGAYKPLKECMKKAGFDLKNDRLICLGDVCDRGSNVKKAIDYLLKVKNLIYILGNHDLWAIKWAESGIIPDIWMSQGGDETVRSFPNGLSDTHLKLLKTAHSYFIDNNKLFVHGGILSDRPIEDQDEKVFLWDRSLVAKAMHKKKKKKNSSITEFKEVYVGHTPTQNFGSNTPVNSCEVWLMDTGAGWKKRLSMMNIETKEVFQSKIK